jgi:hypothetical protein
METTSQPEVAGAQVWPVDPVALQEAIRRRAEEIYIRNGRIPGRDVENWVEAEREIRSEIPQPSVSRRAVVVKVDDVQFVGEYAPASADGYTPGEFSAGDAISLRFEGDRMFVKRPNGRELETLLVHHQVHELAHKTG